MFRALYGSALSGIPKLFLNILRGKSLLNKSTWHMPMKFHGCRHCEALFATIINAGVEDEDVKKVAYDENVLNVFAVSSIPASSVPLF